MEHLAARLRDQQHRVSALSDGERELSAVFDLSYASLQAPHRRLWRLLGLIPGADLDAYAAAALAEADPARAAGLLEDLVDHNLLAACAPGRYRLHDLLRAHARTLAAADPPPAREAAVDRLPHYYAHTALAAEKHIPSKNKSPAATVLPPARPPDCAPPVSTQRQAAAWLEGERANLYAVTGYAAANELPVHAMLIPAAMASFLGVRHYRDQALTLHQTALAAARQAGDRPGQGRALNWVASAQIDTAQFAAAEATLQESLALHRDLGDPGGQADALNGLGRVYWLTGDYPAALSCLQQALRTVPRPRPPARSGASPQRTGRLCGAMTGDYPAAMRRATSRHWRCSARSGHQHGQSEALTHLAVVQRLTGDYPAAATTLQQAKELSHDIGDRHQQAWALDELGGLHRLTGDYPAAAASHQQALEQFRDLGDSASQAHALDELGLVQQLTGDYPAAAASHQHALRLYLDLGLRHGQAEVLNSLGELSSRTAQGDSRPSTTTPGRSPSPANSAHRCRKHVPWKESATATSRTAMPASEPPVCGRH